MKRKGFTLIELLVVIAIIGILATIILVSLSNSAPKARKASALESYHRAASVAQICLAEGGSLGALSSGAFDTNINICSGVTGGEAANAIYPTIQGYTLLFTAGTTSSASTLELSPVSGSNNPSITCTASVTNTIASPAKWYEFRCN